MLGRQYCPSSDDGSAQGEGQPQPALAQGPSLSHVTAVAGPIQGLGDGTIAPPSLSREPSAGNPSTAIAGASWLPVALGAAAASAPPAGGPRGSTAAAQLPQESAPSASPPLFHQPYQPDYGAAAAAAAAAEAAAAAGAKAASSPRASLRWLSTTPLPPSLVQLERQQSWALARQGSQAALLPPQPVLSVAAPPLVRR
jgi:hypothetical protein